MNQKIIAVIVGVIILLGAGGVFLFSKNSPSKTSSPTNPTPTKTESMSPSSLADLLLGGKTQTCSFNDKLSDGATTEGTVYLSGTKMRGDITNTDKNGKVSMFYMIRDGDTTYIWGSSLPTGIKMTLSAKDLKNNTDNANKYTGSFSSTNVKYNCTGWTMDSSKFTVPTNIKFTDVSGMMPKTTGTSTQTGSGYSCAGITDPTAKAACENALKQQGY